MSKNRIKIESKDSEGNEIVVYVTKPTKEDYAQAQLKSLAKFRQACEAGAFVKQTLEDFLLEQGIWNDKKQAKVDAINKRIRDNLTQLKKGGLKLSDARDLAIKVRIDRIEMTTLMAERSMYDSYTAEEQSDAERIDYLMSACVKNEDGTTYFKDMDDYRARSDEPFVAEAASKLMNLLYDLEDDWESELPENKFLKKYNFVNEDLRLVNKDGNFVTIDGKRINDKFQYVDENGNVVDSEGNLLDEDGLPVVQTEPFLDDDGNPILE